jgi:hypothetical protein
MTHRCSRHSELTTDGAYSHALCIQVPNRRPRFHAKHPFWFLLMDAVPRGLGCQSAWVSFQAQGGYFFRRNQHSSGDRVHDSRCLTYRARRQARLERHFTQPERLHRRPMPSPVTRAMSDLDSLYLRSRPTGLSGRSGPEMALRGVPPPPTTPLLQSPVSRYPRLFADLHTNRR